LATIGIDYGATKIYVDKVRRRGQFLTTWFAPRFLEAIVTSQNNEPLSENLPDKYE
jgi:hypothetical protein